MGIWLVSTTPSPIALAQTEAGPSTKSIVDPTPVVDLRDPGPDLPPTGHSVFDALFLDGNGDSDLGYQIPFPFTELLSRIDSELPGDGGVKSALRTALIPLGRSPQRTAGAPQFFKYPHLIVAMDSEPLVARGVRPVLLKDRLFLSYHERAQAIQIIAYNEAAGRFEFQVVENYADGKEARVRYAKRSECVSCHQNAGPIFSDAPWDETHLNRDVAARLARERSSFYGISANPVEANSAAINSSTDRANLFSTYQLIWREGCRSEGSESESVRCRAGAFDAMLQYRLGTFANIDTQSELFWDHFVPVSIRNWRDRWPGGLAIPDADIPNRKPLASRNPEVVDPKLDPKRPRKPQRNWSMRHLGRFIRGMSQLIPLVDLRRLDAHVFEQGRAQNDWRWRFRGPCTMTNHGPLAAGYLITLECRMSGGALGRAFDLVADMLIESGHVASRTINSLTVSDGVRFTGLMHGGGRIEARAEDWVVELGFFQRRGGFHAWLPDGSSVEGIELRWPRLDRKGAHLPPDNRISGQAVLTLVPGFHAVPKAIAEMASGEREGTLDLFAAGAFRPTELMQALFTQLGLEPTPWCCSERRKDAGGIPRERN